ncbi:alternative ribosome rescue aminoacyl-tRNA hydrolase ArfB [Pedobacter nutrimenti]|jgi:ribosome-associated protein|uniref:Ribosome-associated protein n=1 Tax=Pedobacter nutrimenti TaxID=1241337 RepID=A0A318U8J5_9SPHI|nr:alternative ribosome rescue aminoacyl-tRNA hydrolase ArfB [Pedobacter nutrimenti]PYF69511.1 ribosome-associated protein [Pedobacter nutrimenti]|eukprot:gene13929-16430_t
MLPVREDILKTASFKTSRSGGKGGQHVNKVSSKVELLIRLSEVPFLDEQEKTLVISRLANRIDQEGYLHIVSQEDRSQLLNKEKTIAKLLHLLKAALHVEKARKPSKIPRAIVKKRLEEKQNKALKKAGRKKPQLDY